MAARTRPFLQELLAGLDLKTVCIRGYCLKVHTLDVRDQPMPAMGMRPRAPNECRGKLCIICTLAFTCKRAEVKSFAMSMSPRIEGVRRQMYITCTHHSISISDEVQVVLCTSCCSSSSYCQLWPRVVALFFILPIYADPHECGIHLFTLSKGLALRPFQL